MRSPKWKVLKLISVFLPMVLFSLSSFAFDTWVDHSGRLVGLSKQIETIENDIRAIVEEKHKTEDPKQLKEMIDTIAAKHKSLVDVAKDYEVELNQVRFKFPERAEKLDKKYVHYHIKSIQDMEKEMGLDGRLDHLKTRVLATFPIPQAAESKPEGENIPKIFKSKIRNPASEDSDADDDELPHKLHLEK